MEIKVIHVIPRKSDSKNPLGLSACKRHTFVNLHTPRRCLSHDWHRVFQSSVDIQNETRPPRRYRRRKVHDASVLNFKRSHIDDFSRLGGMHME